MERDAKRKGGESALGSRVLFLVFAAAVVLSVGLSFYRFFVLRDYPIQAQIECDPASETCFVYHCDANYEECTGDAIADTSYYKIVERSAKNIPLCDPNVEGCAPFACPQGEIGCSITFCDVNASDGTECSDPEEFKAKNASLETLEEALTDTSTSETELEINMME